VTGAFNHVSDSYQFGQLSASEQQELAQAMADGKPLGKYIGKWGSHVFVTGDVTQVDLPKKNISGLTHALSLLNNIEGIGVIYLTAEDVVRNPLVKKIVKAYENEQNY